MSSPNALDSVDRLIAQGVQFLERKSTEENDLVQWCMDIEDTLRAELRQDSALADGIKQLRVKESPIPVRRVLGILSRARNHVLGDQKAADMRSLDDRIRLALSEGSYRTRGLIIQIALVAATLVFGFAGIRHGVLSGVSNLELKSG